CLVNTGVLILYFLYSVSFGGPGIDIVAPLIIFILWVCSMVESFRGQREAPSSAPTYPTYQTPSYNNAGTSHQYSPYPYSAPQILLPNTGFMNVWSIILLVTTLPLGLWPFFALRNMKEARTQADVDRYYKSAKTGCLICTLFLSLPLFGMLIGLVIRAASGGS
ncbi:MAG TPA: hypothetical protein VN366_06580, partial [Feifaniaceae bacterium]|nr:hypothetical protein [Feifaniaceae bacterium]